MANLLAVGSDFYYTGDMANNPDTGTILAIVPGEWGTRYRVKFHDSGRAELLDVTLFSPVYLGHGGTRFVSMAAYQAWQAERVAEIAAWSERMTAQQEVG